MGLAIASEVIVEMTKKAGEGQGENTQFANIVDADFVFDMHNKSAYDERGALGKNIYLLNKGYIASKGDLTLVIANSTDKKAKETIEGINKAIGFATKFKDPKDYVYVFKVLVKDPEGDIIANVCFDGYIRELPTELPSEEEGKEGSFPEIRVSVNIFDHNTIIFS